MHRTINEMDFSGSELLKDPHINSIGSLRLKASPIFSATAAAVLGEGARAYSVNGESRLLTYAVYVWGEDSSRNYLDRASFSLLLFLSLPVCLVKAFLKWLPAYIKRFHSLGVYNLMVFGDAATYQVCSAIQRAVCLQLDTKNSLHRYTIPLALMNLGVDAFILDFDIYPFQDHLVLMTLKAWQDSFQFQSTESVEDYGLNSAEDFQVAFPSPESKIYTYQALPRAWRAFRPWHVRTFRVLIRFRSCPAFSSQRIRRPC